MTRLTNQEIQVGIVRAETRALLAQPPFRRFVLRYLLTCGIFDPNQGADPVRSAFAEGRRALGIEMLNALSRADHDAAASLMADILPETAVPEPQEDPDGRDTEPFER